MTSKVSSDMADNLKFFETWHWQSLTCACVAGVLIVSGFWFVEPVASHRREGLIQLVYPHLYNKARKEYKRGEFLVD